MKQQFQIESLKQGCRLDVFLSELEQVQLSRSQLLKLIQKGNVQVNSILAKASYKLRVGDVVLLDIPSPKKLDLEAQDLPLQILYQDQHLAVINKPQHLVVHAAAGHSEGTLVNALLFHLENLSNIGGVIRPGIVHRLDKGTSGLMIVAKSNQAHQRLVKMFQAREIHKTYLALCYGKFRVLEGKIENKIGRSISNRKKISSKTSRGKEAITLYKVIKQNEKFSWVELKLLTGRTHQIRVHLSELGHPLLGDPLYGSKRNLSQLDLKLKQLIEDLTHQLLHAYQLEFKHPITLQVLKFTANLPEDYKNLLQALSF